MTTSDAPPDAPPTPPTFERRLSRSRDRRVIAGVCGGFGRYAGIDPVVFRIGLAVLVFFGGVGAVIYLAGWLFLPEDGDTASPAEALLGRGRSSTSTLTTAILAVIAVLVLGIALDGTSALLLALVVLGIVLLARRGPLPDDLPDGTAMAAGHGTGPAPAVAPPQPPSAQSPPPQPTLPIPPPRPPAPPKRPSVLGRVVVSATLLAMGLILAVDHLFELSIPGPWYAATALGMIGSGLVAGAWFGRARALIGVGVVLCVVLPLSTAASDWEPGAHVANQRWVPVTAADIQPSYAIGFGEAALDLTSVDFTDTSATTQLAVGFGHLLVRVPRDVDVTVRGRAGAGNVNLFGKESNGSDMDRMITDLGADGAGGGQLALGVKVGVGELEVLRD